METGYDKELHGTIVVFCEPKQQIERLCQREGISRQKALERIRAQWPIKKKIQKATFVIDTSGSIHETRRQVREVFERIKTKKARRLPLWH